MNSRALKLLKEGKLEEAVLLLAGSTNASKKRAVRNTILVMSQLGDDEWDAIDEWADKKLSNAMKGKSDG